MDDKKFQEQLESAIKEAAAKADDIVCSKYDKVIKPTLAKNFDDYGVQGHDYVMTQPKLDGVRCLVYNEGGKITARSKQGKEFHNVQHIIDQLKDKLKPGDVLDGELYSHFHSFNEIVSLVRKKNVNEEHIEDSKHTIDYIIYDIVKEVPYTKRLLELLKYEDESIEVIEYHHILAEDLDETFDAYIARGYEGQIIRLPDEGYIQGRSKLLLKRKEFIDKEFQILRILEGKGKRKGMAGSLLITDGNKHFKCSVAGTDEFKTRLLSSDVVGKIATVKFFEYTKVGVPRFPVLVEIRDYE